MEGHIITKSIDSFTIEITEQNGIQQVDISRFGLHGSKPEISFIKGDSSAAAGFLSGVAELMGLQITVRRDNHDGE